MKIYHEAPISIMSNIRNVTDGCYALVHLFEENNQYYNHFVESLKLGRSVILDNSIFELGTAFNQDKFIEWIEKLQPTEYIVPDSLEDMEETIYNFNNFNYESNSTKIGVVQGKNLKELVECYKFMSSNADKIAISFDYSYYEQIYPYEINKFYSWMKGRQFFIKYLVHNNIWNFNKPHHLLGCGLPQEFSAYKNFIAIDSVDTSNPVIHGILNLPYSDDGLVNKNTIKMIDLFNKSIDKDTMDLILFNISEFKKLAKV